MLPILLSVGSFNISTFGLFLAFAFIFSVFTIWKLCRIYEIDEEKVTNLAILSFFGGIIGARVWAVAFNWNFFESIDKVLLINRYPGLSFWGGLVGGMLTFVLFARRSKLNFWTVADIGVVGLMLGIAVGDIGCFFGGCAYGVSSNLPIATPIVGLLDKRFPISLIEGLVLFLSYRYLWKREIKFHFPGKITALFFIILGIEKFISEWGRGDVRVIGILNLTVGELLSMILFLFGIWVFYSESKRNLLSDIKNIGTVLSSPRKRGDYLLKIRKNWYNQRVSLKIKIEKLFVGARSAPKNLKRRFHVKSTPTDFK